MKTAIVTGATRGIGKAISLRLLEEGYYVIGLYEKSVEAAKELENTHENIEMHKVDIGDSVNLTKVIEEILSERPQIDVLINNAGINLWGRIEDYKLEDWNRMLDVNVTSKYLLSKLLIPTLKNSDNANIINISSRAGMNEYVFSEFVAYCMNNAATNNFTLALAKELKEEGIRVNAIIPTVTDTDRFKNAFTKEEQQEVIEAGKLGAPEEVADLVIDIINSDKTGELVIDERVFIETEA